MLISILCRHRARVIIRADVERTAKGLVESGPAQPLRAMRRAMAQRMATANAEVVRTTVTDEADIEDWRTGEDTTIRLVHAIAAACKAEPSLNAWYNSEIGERRLIKRIDLGIAGEAFYGPRNSCSRASSSTFCC
jgi:pyruvate dehydrogenase E2 component (dihydrolipoamide acetyltransferase)